MLRLLNYSRRSYGRWAGILTCRFGVYTMQCSEGTSRLLTEKVGGDAAARPTSLHELQDSLDINSSLPGYGRIFAT